MGRDRGTIVAWGMMSGEILVVRPLRPPWRIIQLPVHNKDNSEESYSSIEDKKLKGT